MKEARRMRPNAQTTRPEVRGPRRPTVLVVDDEPGLRSVIREYLGEFGYEVLEAADGRAGLQILRANRSVRVAIVDIFMPEMDGLELLSTLRAVGTSARIIAVSGGARLQSTDHPLRVAQMLGAVVALEKPIDMEVLRAHVEGCLL